MGTVVTMSDNNAVLSAKQPSGMVPPRSKDTFSSSCSKKSASLNAKSSSAPYTQPMTPSMLMNGTPILILGMMEVRSANCRCDRSLWSMALSTFAMFSCCLRRPMQHTIATPKSTAALVSGSVHLPHSMHSPDSSDMK